MCLWIQGLFGISDWGRVTHICVSNLTIIGPDNGFSPGRRQAIIWTNAGILLIWPWGTNFSDILIGIQTFSFKKMHLKMSSAKWSPFCLGPNVIYTHVIVYWDIWSMFWTRFGVISLPHNNSPLQSNSNKYPKRYAKICHPYKMSTLRT